MRLARQHSMPAVPVPETGKVISFWVLKAERSMARTWSMSSRNLGARWPRVGRVKAWRMRGSTGLGPGPSRSRSGGLNCAGTSLISDLLNRSRARSRSWKLPPFPPGGGTFLDLDLDLSLGVGLGEQL